MQDDHDDTDTPGWDAINAALRAVLGLQAAPFNVYSLGGMIWVEGLSSSPLVFLLVSSALGTPSYVKPWPLRPSKPGPLSSAA